MGKWEVCELRTINTKSIPSGKSHPNRSAQLGRCLLSFRIRKNIVNVCCLTALDESRKRKSGVGLLP